MANKKENEFDKMIGFLFLTKEEKTVRFEVTFTNDTKEYYTVKANKQRFDYIGQRITDKNIYSSSLIFIDNVQNITASGEAILKVLK